MEAEGKPISVWCAHGDEWPWDDDEQHYTSPHGGEPNADAGAFPEDCYPTFGSIEAYIQAKEAGIVS